MSIHHNWLFLWFLLLDMFNVVYVTQVSIADFNFISTFGCVIDPPEETFLLQYLAHKIKYESIIEMPFTQSSDPFMNKNYPYSLCEWIWSIAHLVPQAVSSAIWWYFQEQVDTEDFMLTGLDFKPVTVPSMIHF